MAVCEVIIFAGQSNAFGFPEGGFTPPSGSTGVQTDIYIWNTSEAFEPYESGVSIPYLDNGTHYFSWDLKLAKDRLAATAIPQFVFKVAIGGTSLCKDAAGINWHDTGGELRTIFNTKLKLAKEWLIANGWQPTFKLMGWDQGEADVTESTNTYRKEATKLFKQIRLWTGNLTMPILIRNFDGYNTNIAGAHTALAAADSNIYLVTPGTPGAAGSTLAFHDGVHFNAASLWELGTTAGTLANLNL